MLSAEGTQQWLLLLLETGCQVQQATALL